MVLLSVNRLVWVSSIMVISPPSCPAPCLSPSSLSSSSSPSDSSSDEDEPKRSSFIDLYFSSFSRYSVSALNISRKGENAIHLLYQIIFNYQFPVFSASNGYIIQLNNTILHVHTSIPSLPPTHAGYPLHLAHLLTRGGE